MRKGTFFRMLALMICAAGCADNLTDEPKLPMQEEASHEVTQAEARQSLEKIVFDLKIPSTRGGEPRRVPPITSVYSTGRAAEATRSGEDVEPYFHIFNFGNDEGFAIMSGDDRVEPLLALTFKGELTPETEIDNPGFEIAYSRMEDYYIQRTRIGPSINPDIPVPPKDSIGPGLILRFEYGDYYAPVYYNSPLGMCAVQWDQEEPYNKYCFADDYPTELAYTGCTTTAVAQLMSIYKYPGNYNGYNFNWDEMNQYINVSDMGYYGHANKIDQIARLMHQLGLPQNLDAEYGAVFEGNGTPAPMTNVARTLTNFGYADGGTFADYNTNGITAELQVGYPVLAVGYSYKVYNGSTGHYTYTRGHCWLIHGLLRQTRNVYWYNGYDELIETRFMHSWFVLCNMGWSGNMDGYYLSTIFDARSDHGPEIDYDDIPTRSGDEYNFQYCQKMITGIRK